MLLAAVAFVGIVSAVSAVGSFSGIRAVHESSVVAFPAVETPHGPYFESTADLDGAPPVPRSAAHPARDEDAYRTASASSASSALSPAPTAGPFDVTGGGNDPQIAASEMNIVVTTNSRIGFYAKSGRLLTTDHLGNAMRNPIRPFDFFHHMWNGRRNRTNIDFGLKLPPGLHCDVTNTKPKGDLSDACIDTVCDTRVVFDGFRKRLPPLHAASVSIPDSDDPKDGPQFLGGQISYTNLSKNVLRAVMHGPELFVASQDCIPRGSPICGTAARVIRVDAGSALNGFDVKPTLDTTVGGREELFPTFDGDPSLDVNASGDIVVSFLRTVARKGSLPQARYAVIRSSQVERSRVLHKGSANFGTVTDVLLETVEGSNLDTGGAATDPSFRRDGVWVLHAFGVPLAGSQPASGTWGFAFAKVLGRRHPDLTVDGGKLITTSRAALLLGRQVTVKVPIFDDGDGPAGSVRVRALLITPDGKRRVELGTTHTGLLAAGASTTVVIKGTVKASLRPGRYSLEIEITPQRGEYSAANNSAWASAAVAR